MTVQYRRPTTLDDAFHELDHEDAFPLAGGVSLVVLMNTGLLAPSRLVSLNSIPGLTGITSDVASFDIGALTTHAEIASHLNLLAAIPAIAIAFGRIGNVRVRAWGTIGGNLAHADPAQDPPVLLTALGAKARVVGPRGERLVSLPDLTDGPFATTLGPDELITRVTVPVPASNARCSYVKFLPRSADDYATVSAAATVATDSTGQITAATLVLGAVGPQPVVCDDAARILVGSTLGDEDSLRAAGVAVAEVVSPTTDARGSADYKRRVADVVAVRAIRSCASWATR